MFSSPTSSLISILAPSRRADGQRTVHRKLHIAGARRFLTGSRNLLAEIGRRNDLLGDRDAVVRHKNDGKFARGAWVGVDDSRDAVDQLDDLLSGPVARRGLAGKEVGARCAWVGAVFRQAQVLMQDVHDVEKLPLVFVDTLDLHVEQRLGADRKALRLPNKPREFFFVGLLDLCELGLERRIVRQRFQPTQLIEIGDPTLPDRLRNQRGQAGISFQQPAAGRDTIGLVVELFGPQLVEVRHERAFDQLGVQGRNAVDRVAADNREVCHAYLWVRPFLNQGHPYLPPAVVGPFAGDLFQKPPVDLINDL